MQPETRFKLRVMADLKTLPRTWFVKIQQESIRGIPDILACIDGNFVALELKKEKKKADPLQQYNIRRIIESSGFAAVAYPNNWQEIFEMLSKLAHRKL